MNNYKSIAAPLIAAALTFGSAANAAVTTQMLGDADFTNGQTVGTGVFTGANAGDPAPFNQFIGSDVTGPNFSASFTFSYGAIAAPITSATILLGLYEGESAASGSQVASFTVDGIAITALLNTAMETTPGAISQENYYTVSLPGTTFAALADGSATFLLNLQGPGLGALGETTFNGAGLDFATLTINSQPQGGRPVPEPATWSVLLLGGVGLLVSRRRARRG